VGGERGIGVADEDRGGLAGGSGNRRAGDQGPDGAGTRVGLGRGSGGRGRHPQGCGFERRPRKWSGWDGRRPGARKSKTRNV